MNIERLRENHTTRLPEKGVVMTQESNGRADIDSTGWELLERLYFEGLHLDRSDRIELLAPYLDRHQELITELESLWSHEPHTYSLFDTLPRIFRSFWDGCNDEELPERIGPYQVIEELGRGGMGVVYKARQPPPLSRLVAVKVLPATLQASAWRTRFEVEQKSLSVMNHPNIATVHDAGVTSEDQPFLVMELLEGLPITRYCDTHTLSIEERLRLFVQICEGVNHAHRKGIIHRDLKPSNILVVDKDGRHVPKIIDFGIAGSVGVTASSKGGVMGTPAYMSPEQAARQKDKIDTRGDIYSLGVLLFELLSGKTPLDARLRAASDVQEQCRLVRHCSPEPLARQITSLATPEIAHARATTVPRLVRGLKGELDWITRKTLARAPEDRYGSCSELVEDLHRLRKNKPIAAAPDQNWYPLKKWFATHKLLVASAAALLLALVLTLVISRVSLRAVRTSERHLRNVQEFSESIFKKISPYDKGREVKAVELLDDAVKGIEEKYAGQPELEQSIRLILANTYQNLGLYASAEVQFARVYELALATGRPDDEQTLSAQGERAFNLFQAGQAQHAYDLYQSAVTTAEKAYGWKHPLSLRLRSGFAFVLGRMGRKTQARPLFETTLAQQRASLGPSHPETLATINNLGDLLLAMNQFIEAEHLIGQGLAAYQAQKKPMDPFAADLMDNLAMAFLKQKRYPEAIELGQKVLTARNEFLGSYHPKSLNAANNLATAIGESRSPQQAVQLLRQALDTLPKKAVGSPDHLKLRHNLGHFLMVSGDFVEAETVLRETWRERMNTLGPADLDTLITHFTLGEVLWSMSRRSEARGIFRDVVEYSEQSLESSDPYYKAFHAHWFSIQSSNDEP